ncbi:MAG: hypothetical protein ABI083_02415 [Lapillicoccus sp.]
MNRRTKIAASAASATIALTALTGVWLSGSASAATPSNTTSVSTAAVAPGVASTSLDTDTLQQGDQTTPDKARAADPADPASSSKAEVPEGMPESAAASDGPGGHADPAGDVQHEGGANEQ